MSGARFYVELPQYEDACTALPAAVIEGRIVQGGTPEAGHFPNPGRQVLLIDGPPEVAGPHPGTYTDSYGGFAETEGPARMLSLEEYEAIIARLEAAR